ncbi:unnamed protein product [Vitrella brassicaformis CCMP3155]|uniref:Uncharacterized protein n=1 Tax=Vitrella brassicaformis (strain CCMP3155) TaxID=1169540 RepID=A0A0G4E8U7_VITBC|nr:unnamed protein product [Vitrella brassicaformis CCMP3155]|eukprot:CEL91925.1 unnamed protein product [Vitrella brassicaformis CCMP3155]
MKTSPSGCLCLVGVLLLAATATATPRDSEDNSDVVDLITADIKLSEEWEIDANVTDVDDTTEAPESEDASDSFPSPGPLRGLQTFCGWVIHQAWRKACTSIKLPFQLVYPHQDLFGLRPHVHQQPPPAAALPLPGRRHPAAA